MYNTIMLDKSILSNNVALVESAKSFIKDSIESNDNCTCLLENSEVFFYKIEKDSTILPGLVSGSLTVSYCERYEDGNLYSKGIEHFNFEDVDAAINSFVKRCRVRAGVDENIDNLAW